MDACTAPAGQFPAVVAVFVAVAVVPTPVRCASRVKSPAPSSVMISAAAIAGRARGRVGMVVGLCVGSRRQIAPGLHASILSYEGRWSGGGALRQARATIPAQASSSDMMGGAIGSARAIAAICRH